jgi:hypothetical protein
MERHDPRSSVFSARRARHAQPASELLVPAVLTKNTESVKKSSDSSCHDVFAGMLANISALLSLLAGRFRWRVSTGGCLARLPKEDGGRPALLRTSRFAVSSAVALDLSPDPVKAKKKEDSVMATSATGGCMCGRQDTNVRLHLYLWAIAIAVTASDRAVVLMRPQSGCRRERSKSPAMSSITSQKRTAAI